MGSKTPWIAPDATPGPSMHLAETRPTRLRAAARHVFAGPGTRRGRLRGNKRANGSLTSRISLGKEALRKSDPTRTLTLSVQAALQLQRRRRDELQRLRSVLIYCVERSSPSSCVCLCCGTLAQGRSRSSQQRQQPAGIGPGPRSPATSDRTLKVEFGGSSRVSKGRAFQHSQHGRTQPTTRWGLLPGKLGR